MILASALHLHGDLFAWNSAVAWVTVGLMALMFGLGLWYDRRNGRGR